MEFKDRKGTNLNRKKIKIISQTQTEIIADIERFDNVTEEGTEINANVFNTFQSEINTAKSEANTAGVTANNANTTANSALSNANNAIEIATSAKTIAESAKNIANLTSTELSTLTSSIMNIAFPVGAIYMSVNSTNPGSLFGGTWEAWGSGRVPLAIGNNGETDYTVAEQTGGSENSVAVHNHLQNEHNHTQNAHYHNILSLDNGWSANSVPANPQGTSRGMAFLENNNWAEEYSHVARFDTTGGIQDRQIIRNTTAENNSTTATNQEAGVAGGNRMPYITCYMWKRTA